MGFYIPASKLPNLRNYKYSSVDKSLLSYYVLQPYWTWLVEFVPMWVAPNLVTLSGLLLIVACVLHLLIVDPLLDRDDLPPWMFVSWGVSLFVYQSLDAIDGKQARRTGMSGPMGEMFDHGCDAINTTLVAILSAKAMNLGESWATVAGLYTALASFYLSTWEEYYTGTLFLSYISGPVEGILMLVGTFFITAYTGPAFWSTPINYLFHLPQGLPLIPLNYCLIGISLSMIIPTSILSIITVGKACKAKGRSAAGAMLSLVPYIIIPALGVPWLYYSPTLLHRNLVPFFLYQSAVFNLGVGRVITAHVTSLPFPRTNLALLPMLFGAINAALPLLGHKRVMAVEYESAYLVVSAVFAWAAYTHFVLDVISTVCKYMDINCLTIKHKKKAE